MLCVKIKTTCKNFTYGENKFFVPQFSHLKKGQ